MGTYNWNTHRPQYGRQADRNDDESLEAYAKQIAKMFYDSKRDDPLERLVLAAGMAGHVSHLAVKSDLNDFQTVLTRDGRKFYVSESVNRYLFGNDSSVCTELMEYYDRLMGSNSPFRPDLTALGDGGVSDISGDNYLIAGKFTPESAYNEVRAFWLGISEKISSEWHLSPDKWPVVFGKALQFTLLRISAPPENLVRRAMKCAADISLMGEGSVKAYASPLKSSSYSENIQEETAQMIAEKMIYLFYDSKGRTVPLDANQERFVHEAIDTAREFFKENQIAFSLASDTDEMTKTMEFQMSIAGEVTTVWFKISMKPLLFSIVFYIPFRANLSRIETICRELCEMNYGRFAGTFEIDPSDGQIINISSFPCYGQMCKDNMIMSFIHNMNVVSKNMPKFKEFAK